MGTTGYYQWRANDFLERCKQSTTSETALSYYLNYGHKYVHRFQQETRKQLSKRGKDWLDKALLELQLILETKLHQDPEIELDADRLHTFAFQSHVHAYQKTGFFDLSLNDIRLILATLDFKDSFVNRKGRRQIIDIITRYFELRFLRNGR